MIENKPRNYRLLGENRIFPETINGQIFNINSSFPSIEYFRNLSGAEKTETRILRKTILEIFDIKNLSEIPNLFCDEARKKEVYRKFINNYGNVYNIGINIPSIQEITGKDIQTTTEEQINNAKKIQQEFEKINFLQKEEKIIKALNNADDVIKFFENSETGILRKYDNSIGQVNEIEAIKNPIDLLLLCFSQKASEKTKFEARRKLVLMDLALKTNLEMEKQNNNMDKILRFFNTHIWVGNIGETKRIEAITQHEESNYQCKEVKILQDNDHVKLEKNMRYEIFDMREFESCKKTNKNNGVKNKFASFISRRKDNVSAYLKALRLDTKDVEKIHDHIGIRIICENKYDCYDFIESMISKGIKSGQTILLEDLSDTINNSDEFNGSNKGSSKQLEIIKANLIINGIKVELQMHTIRTYLDSRYRDNIGMEEYIIKRLFESGTVNLLYPENVYQINFDQIKNKMIKDRRESTRKLNEGFLIRKK